VEEQQEQTFVEQMRAVLKKQLADFEVAQKAKEHRARMVSVEGPKKWRELKDCLETCIGEINEGLDDDGLLSLAKTANDNEIRLIHELSRRDILIVFDPSSASISYKSDRGKGQFLPYLDGDSLEYEWKQMSDYSGFDPYKREGRAIALGDCDYRSQPKLRLTWEMSEIIVRCAVHLG